MELSSIYQRLDSKQRQFHLVQLTTRKSSKHMRCKLRTFNIDSSPRYKALSYAWGTIEGQRDIFLGDHKLRIRRNLYDFLRVLQNREDRGLIWIDQLCIDQSSIEEKADQVGIMEQIYRGATQTFLWLGPDPNSVLALAAMPHYLGDRQIPFVQKKETPVTQAESDALWEMLSVSYWSRHWVAQEVALSKVRTVVYGSNIMSWREIYLLTMTKPSSRLVALLTPSVRGEQDNDSLGQWRNWTFFTRGSLCQDSRDKVFGIQSIFKLDLRIVPDYTLSAAEVYMATAERWYIKLFPRLSSLGAWIEFQEGCVWLAEGMGFSEVLERNKNLSKYQVMYFHHVHFGSWLKQLPAMTDIGAVWKPLSCYLHKYMIGFNGRFRSG